MGKRKERRLAALSNAGRRVKLDLYAEPPSGDLGGSFVNDDESIETETETGGGGGGGGGGGDIDPEKRAPSPSSSSSSSGQQQQNPLLLLGQYSDDELDDESNKRQRTANGKSPSDHNDQGPCCERKDRDANFLKQISSQKNEQQSVERYSTPIDVSRSPEVPDSIETSATASTDICKDKESTEKISISGISNAQIVGDVSSGWKIVMHEESNQYYYWNTVTGETSWEVPDVLEQATQLATGQNYPALETAYVGSDSSLGVGLENSTVAQTMGANLVPENAGLNGNGLQTDEQSEGIESVKGKNWAAGVDENKLQNNSSVVNALSGDGSLDVVEQSQDAEAKDELQRGIGLSTRLVAQCERLLDRLKSLEGYESHLQGHERIAKYICEVEIRLSDIKSLSSHGLSLLPFWAHSERQLNQLEDVVNKEIYQLAISAQIDDDVEAVAGSSFKENQQSQEGLWNESLADKHNNKMSAFSPSVHKDSCNKTAHEWFANDAHTSPLESAGRDLESTAIIREELNNTTELKHEVHSVEEDVDMDVDMEVEEGVPLSNAVVDASTTKDPAPTEQLPKPPVECIALPSIGDMSVPPPPEEEWIPPPPPDNDQIPPPPPDYEQDPPPPPDEPPESSYPALPSYIETNHLFPYAEQQYNLVYPNSDFQYYGNASTVPSTSFYGQADGSQVAAPHPSLYYQTVPNTYSEMAPVIVNPVEPVPYYNIDDVSIPAMPVVNGTESSLLHAESGPVTYGALPANHGRTVNDPAEAGPSSNVSTVGAETELASTGDPSTSTTSQASADVKEGVSVSGLSTSAVTAAAAVFAQSVGTKGPPKAQRSKKRTVAVVSSLRSNKKVSSLVDKWKAAKEELNENEEDEPENAYQILEKKRQREIEEWRAKQIASGEAKDNANFQPLGGDWRERVKRRRAQAAKEAATTAPEAPADGNQQHDLAELSKGLPSGWQAYWDEASKQIYYGNSLTSETTWTRPK